MTGSTPLGYTNSIEVCGLRRVYGTGEGAFEAVRGIDLVVGAGAIVALLGTNGAGKTSPSNWSRDWHGQLPARFACSVWTR